MISGPVKEYFSAVINRIEAKQWPSYFEAKPQPYFPHSDERSIEVPWALSRYQGQRKILEIGLSLADLSLIQAQIKLKELTGCALYGLDIVDINRVLDRFKPLGCDIRQIYEFYQADARDTSFKDNSFDLIFLISTLEHFGFDSFEPAKDAGTVFKRKKTYLDDLPGYGQCKEDKKALAEVKRILAPGGTVLLTLPFGSRGICVLKDSKGLWAFYKEYSLKEWQQLLESSGMTIVEERFFYKAGQRGWVECQDAVKLSFEAGSIEDATNRIACVELKK